MSSILYMVVGLYTICTQDFEAARTCVEYYTSPTFITQTWADYAKYKADIVKYTDGKIR